jgi:hypothetical protein
MGTLISLALAALFALAQPAAAAVAPQDDTGGEDIKAFMQKVLERRDVNWDDQYNYVFSERETLEFGSSFSAAPLQGFTSEYVWYVRDGYLVRSPVSVNGAPVPDDDRKREEDGFINSAKKGKKSGQGIDRDQFFGFDFKKGEFLYAGKKEYKGQEVTVIEFYPEGTFKEGDDKGKENLDVKIERGLDKSMMAILYVIPEEHQIVRMELGNIDFGFLPGKWLVRIDEIGAAITMAKQYGKVWLPEEIGAAGKAVTAYGDLYVRYTRRFYDYRQAQVRVQFRFEPRKEEK